MRNHAPSFPAGSPAGFTLVEMIVVVFLLALAMLGILSVFDASARINKSESDIADAQGAVRYGIYSMTRAIRMAGSGGLYVTQAVVNRNPGLPGLSVTNTIDGSYDNVQFGTTVTPTTGTVLVPVRPGTDMIEIRGVINSPLIGFDLQHGCEPCNPVESPSGGCSPCIDTARVNAAITTNTAHVNDNASNRPQFSQVDAYTAGTSDGLPMFVLVAFNDDVRTKCAISDIYPLYPQSPYNVGKITAQTNLRGTPPTFGDVVFDDPNSTRINAEKAGDPAKAPYTKEKNVRHAGILDDLIFFIDNTNPLHPALAQGTRRGDKFDIVTLADDVEDMQIAYGVDVGRPHAPTNPDNAIGLLGDSTPSDADSNVSSQPAGDEWVPNVAGADNPITGDATPYLASQFVDTPNFCPRLHGVMIALVAKSHDPDPTYRSPSARGYLTMNSPVTIAPPYPDTAQYSGIPVTTYRRRVQTLKINLRNYAYEGS